MSELLVVPEIKKSTILSAKRTSARSWHHIGIAMECPHLGDCIKIDRDFIKTKKLDLSSAEGSTGSVGVSASVTTTSKQWRCAGKHFLHHVHRQCENVVAFCVIFLSFQPDPVPSGTSVWLRPLAKKTFKVSVLM